MDIDVGSDRRQRRESLFTRMVMAFAHGDLAALEEGVRSDVELTLRGSSWLAGKYRGYEEFGQYAAGAKLVLWAANRQLSYLHAGDEMTVVHDFLVGGGALLVEMPLHEVVNFDGEDLVESLLIRPWDQHLFDEAVNAFLVSTAIRP